MTADTNVNAESPRPLGFVEVERTSEPPEGPEASWIGWTTENKRANRLQFDKDQLVDEIRELDKNREALAERVRSLGQMNRLKTAMASLLICVSGILSGIAISMAKSGGSPGGTLELIVGLMVVFMVSSLVVMCWPNKA